MNEHMSDRMAEVLRLTGAGRLTEATATIQRILRNTSASEASTAGPGDDTAIEAEYRVVDDSPSFMKSSVEGTLLRTEVPPRSATARPAVAPEVLSPDALRLSGLSRVIEPMRLFMPDAQSSLVHAGGQFVDGTYSNKAGTRPYKLYVPSGYTGQAVPLVVLLHGCTQTPVDFAAGTQMNVLAEEKIFLVAYPEQVRKANSSKCWNWFQVADQQRGAGEPSLLAGITQQIMQSYHVDVKRVYVAGLSSGGAMAAILAATYSDLYAAVGVHSGLAYGAAHDLPSAFAAMKQGAAQHARQLADAIPLIVFHGDCDTTVAPVNADSLLNQWLHAANNEFGIVRDATVKRGQVVGGHRYTRSIYEDADGRTVTEKWIVHRAGHAWFGGNAAGSYTDPKGPDASAELVRFFAEHPRMR